MSSIRILLCSFFLVPQQLHIIVFHFDNGVYFHSFLPVLFYSLISSCALCYRHYQIKYKADNLGIEVLK